VLEAFDTLFNKRDYQAAERFWAPDNIQHSAHIAPGRQGVFDLIKSLPDTLRYEHGVIMAEGDFVSSMSNPNQPQGEQRIRATMTVRKPGVS
jgi:predicted SnoaL-like aldol condensation-catalyzing enzyme